MTARAPAWLVQTPIAHRGLHGADVPELSQAALRRAVDAGVGVEIDVRLSRDGTVVVVHDADTDRVTGVHRVVADTDVATLTALTALGTSEQLLTLRDVLMILDGAVPLLIEVKHGVTPAEIGPAVLACLADYQGAWAVQSFDPRTIRWFAQNAPTVVRGQIAGDLSADGIPLLTRLLLEPMVANVLTRPQFVAYDIESLPCRSVTFWRTVLRCSLVAWTVRSEQHLALCRRLGAGVIFEDIAPPAGTSGC